MISFCASMGTTADIILNTEVIFLCVVFTKSMHELGAIVS